MKYTNLNDKITLTNNRLNTTIIRKAYTFFSPLH